MTLSFTTIFFFVYVLTDFILLHYLYLITELKTVLCTELTTIIKLVILFLLELYIYYLYTILRSTIIFMMVMGINPYQYCILYVLVNNCTSCKINTFVRMFFCLMHIFVCIFSYFNIFAHFFFSCSVTCPQYMIPIECPPFRSLRYSSVYYIFVYWSSILCPYILLYISYYKLYI